MDADDILLRAINGKKSIYLTVKAETELSELSRKIFEAYNSLYSPNIGNANDIRLATLSDSAEHEEITDIDNYTVGKLNLEDFSEILWSLDGQFKYDRPPLE